VEIQILGAHLAETSETRLTALLIDDILAIDAGALTSVLSLSSQEKVRAILLTHRHFDHVRDIATLGLNKMGLGSRARVYSIASVLEVLQAHLINGILYPHFNYHPSVEEPTLKLCALQPYERVDIEGYQVLPLPVEHGVPAVGYQVTSADGRRFFYTGDTGRGLAPVWKRISPHLLITEASVPNRMGQMADGAGHLTPEFLMLELREFARVKGYLPRVVVIHLNPTFEGEIAREIKQVSEELGASISLGHEGMRIDV
jgi:cAMP phosphodiesterase